MKEGQKTLRVEGLDYVDDVEMFSLWTINRNKNCQKTSPNLVKIARGHEAYWEAGRPSEDWTISPSRSHEASPSTRFSSHYASGIAFANAENPMKKAGLVVLSAGVGGMLVWVGVLGQDWLRRELAYQRWRRLRTPQRARSCKTASPV